MANYLQMARTEDIPHRDGAYWPYDVGAWLLNQSANHKSIVLSGTEMQIIGKLLCGLWDTWKREREQCNS